LYPLTDHSDTRMGKIGKNLRDINRAFCS
jgi:hypothetical protein